MTPRIHDALQVLPDRLAQHVLVCAAALGLATAIGLPLAVAAAQSPRLRAPVLGVAGLIQTIPGLALMALFYPLLLALSTVTKRVFGAAIPSLGFAPALAALTLYALLPILRNGIAGLAGVDPAAREAAKGVGMTARQRLFVVEAPLAAPVVMGGLRTAAVWTIGAATLATSVGQTSLGNYIFSGLQTEDWVSVLFGCAAAAALALTVDGLLGLAERGAELRDPKRLALAAALTAAGLIAAAAETVGGAAGYRIGAKNFSEQYILADLMADRLRTAGARVDLREDLGSAVAFRALRSGDIDAYVDYSGTLWTNVLGRTDRPPRADMLKQLSAALEQTYGVRVLGALGFENAYAFAMLPDRAKQLGIVSIADLSQRASQLTLGADLEFLARPEWTSVRTAYDLSFRATRSFDPTLVYRALESRGVDAITAFSSDGRILADHLTVLTDPRGALPNYDAVVLLAPKRAHDQTLISALTPLIGAIDVCRMRVANLEVDRAETKLAPTEAARRLDAEIASHGSNGKCPG